MTKNKTKYVDGFVLIVPKKNIDAYKKMAKEGRVMWMQCGALDYMECMGDDLNPAMGGMPIFPFQKMIQAKKNETVWFSFIMYKSRAHRDQVNKKVYSEMAKKAEKYKDMKMPFDTKKMAYGGFEVIVGNK